MVKQALSIVWYWYGVELQWYYLVHQVEVNQDSPMGTINQNEIMKAFAWACLKMHDKSVSSMISALHIIVFNKKVFFICFTFSLFIYLFLLPKKKGQVLMIVMI